jgi:hypothetical protein
MKTYYRFLFLVIFIYTGVSAFAQHFPPYMIPAANVPVEGIVNFVEDRSSESPDQTKAKRKVNVRIIKTPAKDDPMVQVCFYSLDHRSTIGPFEIKGDGYVQADIDERVWGVVIESVGGLIYADVWIVEENP